MDLHLNNNQSTLTYAAAYANFLKLVRELEGRHVAASVFFGGSYIQAIVGSIMVTVMQDQSAYPSTFATDFPNAIAIGEQAPLRSVAQTS